jgi:hypothetical protein
MGTKPPRKRKGPPTTDVRYAFRLPGLFHLG